MPPKVFLNTKVNAAIFVAARKVKITAPPMFPRLQQSLADGVYCRARACILHALGHAT